MKSLRMENITIVFIVLSFVIYFLDCALVEGKVLDPIYWNASNSMFKSPDGRRTVGVDAAISDKLDIICPRRGRDDGQKLFYFKLYLVNEENFKKCNATGGRRFFTCDVPDQEKKYTFYFQEISPSPWGLEFEPEKSYYVVSTSDGTKSGIDVRKGGVCTQFNMRLQLKIHPAEDISPVVPPSRFHPKPSDPAPKDKENSKNVINDHLSRNPQFTNDGVNSDDHSQDENSSNNNTEDNVSGNGLIIGVVLGACAVIFIVFLSFLGYKIYRRRRHHKKYQSPPMTPTRGNTPMQQVTLLPITAGSHHGHHHHHGRLHSDRERSRSATLSSHSDLRPPPSYNESFLDNGGPVVAV